MNRIHRTVWNPRRGAYMVAAETTRSRGKASAASGALLAGVLMGAVGAVGVAHAAGPAAAALPTGAQVTAGQAQIATAGSTLTVTQGSAKAAINWGSFSIGKDATVQFVQPNASAVALNRVTGTEGSVIDGALSANGQVFILNPNGVLFGKGARVDTAGLVATTLGLSDADFLAGKTGFTGHGGAVVNQGSLTAKDGGYIALIGQQVRNDGTITARLGTVALAAGDKVSLNFNGDSLVGVAIDAGALDALVANGGAIRADGGLVVLTAQGAEGLVNTLVNNTGEIRAQTVENKAGRIYLLGEGGKVEVAGTLDASAPGAGAGTGAHASDGGFIETSGSTLVVKDGATVRTNAKDGASGTWLIDPTDFTIGAGTGTQTTSGIGATTLQTALGTGNVTIQTQATGSAAGDINVNAPVAWSANLLTLEAHGDINVNAVMTASGTSTLNLKTGYNFNTGSPVFDETKTVRMGFNADRTFAGRIDIDRTGTGILSINNADYTLINSLGAAGSTTSADLQGMAGTLTGRYALATNIDASTTSTWNSGAGFTPIGTYNNTFTGRFDGLGHTVSGLSINDAVDTGLFGAIGNGAALRNVALTGASVTATKDAGVLVGRYFNTTVSTARIDNVHVAGTLSATGANIGGLLGNAYQGATINSVFTPHNGSIAITNASAAVSVTRTGSASASYAGGLTGNAKKATIQNSFATGDVSTPLGGAAGGLAGYLEDSVVDGSYATGNAVGLSNVGGLVGEWLSNSAGSTINLVRNSHASGNATSTDTSYSHTGGLIGDTYHNSGGLTITGSHATGNVIAVMQAGGLLGGNEDGTITVTNSYATGAVTSTTSAAGGLIGEMAAGLISGSQASGLVSGRSNVGGLVGSSAGGHIVGSQATGTATATATNMPVYVGGLVGNNASVIEGSQASGNVSGWGFVGGLVGYNTSAGSISGSQASGAASGFNWIAGLVGVNEGSIATSFATGNASGTNYVGGLVGVNHNGSISDTYARGNATGSSDYAGGLVGVNNGGTITRSYSTGAVSVPMDAGGLVGIQYAGGTATNSFYDATVNPAGALNNGIGTGQSTADMNSNPLFTGAGWDFTLGTGVWGRRDDINNKYPVLRTFGYTDRIGLISIDPTYLSNPSAALSYTSSGLLSGDGVTLTQSGNTLSYAFSDPSRAGYYDAVQVRAQATTGDLTIARPITWNNFRLILESAGDVNVNAVMSATGTATLDVKTGYNFNTVSPAFNAAKTLNMAMDANGVFTGRVDIDRTGTGILTINNQGYTLINSVGAAGDELGGSAQTLQGMARQANLTGNYALASNIDASGTAGWNSNAGFKPIGTISGSGITTNLNVMYSGAFDGLGHSISGLTEARGSSSTGAGLFGGVTSAALRNLALVDVNISGHNEVGALAGEARNVNRISNISLSGVVSGDPNAFAVGGLVGWAPNPTSGVGSIQNVRSTATVTGGIGGTGGLVGLTDGFDISDASVTGNVTAPGESVGGLVGDFEVGTLTRVSATGSVAGSADVGGLIGYSYGITLVQATYGGPSVTGTGRHVGGLIGTTQDSNQTTISASQSSGTITGTSYVGGLVGNNSNIGGTNNLTIDGSSSSATVVGLAGANYVGGAVGYSDMLTMTHTQTSGNVTGGTYIGGLVGSILGGGGSIGTSSASGNITASGGYAGGLAGKLVETSITGSSATGAVSGHNGYLGGLAGWMSGSSTVTNDHATGAVSQVGGGANVGGLVGYSSGVDFLNSYATGNVSSDDNRVGGLVGYRQTGSVAASYATGNVSGASNVGGLIGYDGSPNYNTTDVYARGNVSATGSYVGGLIGHARTIVTNAYSTGSVTGAGNVGGLIGGGGSPTVINSFWDVQTSGIGTAGSTTGSFGGTGRTTADLNTNASFTTAGWNFTFATGIWGRKDTLNDKYPVLRAFGYTDPLTITVGSTQRVYGDANPAPGSLVITGGCAPNCANYVTGAAWGSAVTAATGVGNYAYSAPNVLGFTFANGYNAGMFDITLAVASLTIAPRPVSLATASGATRVYDRTTDVASGLFTLGNLANGDSVSLTGAATLASANAGTEAVSGIGSLALGNANYTLLNVVPTGSVVVSPRAVSVATTSGATRIYDATTDAAASLLQVGSVLNGDTVNLGGTATLASRNVGAQAVAVAGLTLDNANYTLASVVPTGTVAITPRPVSLTTAAGATRIYDRTTDAAGTLFTLGNLAGNDTVSLTGAATLAGANAGTEAVSGIGTLALSNANYTLVNVVPTGSVVVSPRAVSVATVNGATRIYDATTDAAASLLQVGGVLNGDTVNLGGTATLASRNVGAQAVGVAGLTLDNANYTLASVTPTGTVAITPRPVSVATTAGATRIYDRTTDAAGTLFTLGNLAGNDTVSLSGAATLAGANAGTEAVTGIGTLALSSANYTLVNVAPTGSVVVSPRAVSVTTASGATRVYDGTTEAAASLLQVGGVLSGDTANLAGTATLASKNVGARAVGLGSLALDNANYTLVGVAPTGTVAILPRTLNLSFTVADKTFDGSTAASATAADNRVSGDQLSAQFSAAYADTNAGSAKPVAITGLALTGADAGNYQLASSAGSGVTGNMLTRSVTYTLAAQDPAKTYTATGQVLVSASALDQLVVASFANTVAGTSPGALSYTIYKSGQQVNAITDAGSYEIRASFAAADPHYALASTGNSALTIVVAAAAGTTPPTSTTVGPVAEVVAQAVRTDVPVSTAAVVASAGIGAPRSLVDFSAMPPNVATSPAALTAAFGEGVPLSLLSSPSGAEPSQAVTLAQASQMVTPSGSANANRPDVRVPVSRNSLAQIVNGGVRLPGGVDQLLFVVKADK